MGCRLQKTSLQKDTLTLGSIAFYSTYGKGGQRAASGVIVHCGGSGPLSIPSGLKE